nr:hypothetical protein [Tanacetum cinerariifolium]
MNDSMIELRETFQAWLQQQVVNLDSYTPEPSQRQKTHIYYDGDDDEESYTPLRDIIISELHSCITITPVLSIEVPKDSLIMGDEHLDTVPEKESDEFIKSSVKNLVPNPSESENECECDVPDCDDSQTTSFSTFSNPLFDDSTYSDDKSSYKEVIQEMSFKTYSNPLFDLDEEIISSEFNPILNEDLDSTLKMIIDSFIDEFVNELIFLKSIPSGIDEADCNPKEDIHFVERLFDPFIEEIDLFLAYDGSIPLGIDSDYSDFEWDNLFLERLLHDDPIPFSDTLDFLNVV